MARRGEELLRYLYWITMNRFRKNTFDRPAQMEAAPQCVGTHTKFPCPNRYGLSLAVIGQEMVISPIDRLFSACRPARIFHAIRAVVIAAFNRKTRLICWPHIRQEVLKFVPSFADLDSTTAIVFIGIVLFIVASSAHKNPCVINGCMRHSVSFLGQTDCFALATTATSCMPANKMRLSYGDHLSTIADTFPYWEWFAGWRKLGRDFLDSNKAAKSPTSDIDNTFRSRYSLLSHDFSPFKKSYRLEPVTAPTAIGSLIVRPQFCGVKP